ncbi:MAG: hypothetical protein HXO38_08785 [Prevotella sp.]|uniref:hypothetical protein n=1 Tax=Prevotella melaninogenica TaxID=28132 RepID=UPI001BA9F73E|nr:MULTISPECIES: hypothetical protein [Prevotella]MBF1609918.1 hypothetical protein [Prevotella sp.]QUB69375.1 hypothetical protein J5A68_13560 [Prevotella melaninogenica]
MTDNYDDIIHLPRHVSKRHPQMSLYNRAAQFAPFAALTGYGAAIAETARQTSPKIEMMEDDRQLMDRKLSILSSHLEEEPIISITFFQPDGRKAGGHYLTTTGIVKTIRTNERIIIMKDRKKISIDAIVGLEGELFSPNKL